MKTMNFLCVGAQKAGTTTLHDILKQHPDIYLPDIKETKFFADHEKFNRGLEYYKNEFYSDSRGKKVIGEIDPEYMYFDYVPERIYKTLGKDVKLIFMLRNPASRAFSHYLMSLRRGYETLSFEDAIKNESERIKVDDTNKKWLSKRNNFSYIDRGYYAKQIERYLKFFPKENMHFILFEDEFLKHKEETLNDIYKFLGIKSGVDLELNLKSNPATEPKFIWLRDVFRKESTIKNLIKVFIPKQMREHIRNYFEKINSKPVTQKLDKELKKEILHKYYLEEIKTLELIINKDLSEWLN